MEPSFDSWTIIFLIAACQGIFLAVLIFLKRSLANSYLSLLILGFSLCLIYYVLFWTHYAQTLSPYLGILQGLTYTFGPLAFGYIRASKYRKSLGLVHFIPFVLYVIYFLSWNLYPESLRTTIATLQSVLQNIHLVIYALFIFNALGTNHNYSNGELKRFRWQKSIGFAFLGYTISFVSYFILVWSNMIEIIYDYGISVMSTVFIYYIGYKGFHQPELLTNRKKYQKSALTTSVASSIANQTRELMVEEKLYLDSNLNLQAIASKLGYPAHYVSQALNDIEKKNLSDFINEYRISDAKELIREQTDLKIIEIAYRTGFNNKASFNNAFKRFEGIPPSKFREKESQHLRV